MSMNDISMLIPFQMPACTHKQTQMHTYQNQHWELQYHSSQRKKNQLQEWYLLDLLIKIKQIMIKLNIYVCVCV